MFVKDFNPYSVYETPASTSEMCSITDCVMDLLPDEMLFIIGLIHHLCLDIFTHVFTLFKTKEIFQMQPINRKEFWLYECQSKQMYFVQFEKKLVTKYHITLRGEDIEQVENMYQKSSCNDHFPRKGVIR